MGVYLIEESSLYDLLVPEETNERFHLIGFKAIEYDSLIQRYTLRIGNQKFVPNESYRRFGDPINLTKGLICYEGLPLVFYGTYRDNALFTLGQVPFKPEIHAEINKYFQCFVSWKYFQKKAIFVALTNTGATRKMSFLVAK